MSNTYYNSEIVYSNIGDYPVTDQFDVGYTDELEGSIYDHYMTGSMLTRTVSVSATGNIIKYVPGERSRLFSKTNPNNGFPSIKNSDSGGKTSYESQLLIEKAGIIRIIKIFSNSERFYDSLVPNVTNYVTELGGKISLGDGTSSTSPELYGVIRYDWLTTPKPDYSVSGLAESFPFEPKFSKIKRVKTPTTSLTAKYKLTGMFTGTDIDPVIITSVAISFAKENLLDTSGGAPLDVGVTWQNNSGFGGFSADPEPLNKNDVSKILFGIYPKRYEIEFKKLSIGTPRRWSAFNKFPKPRSSSSTVSLASPPTFWYQRFTSPVIEGWKYGLVDGNPHYTSCVFRRDRYGQFRDMLEQRLNSDFTYDEENSPLNYVGYDEEPTTLPSTPPEKSTSTIGGFIPPNINYNFSSQQSSISDPAVRVNFTKLVYIESSKELVYFNEKPENTWSSNLSTYATSSLPYFDGISKNRGEVTTPSTLSIITTLSDVFGNISIT